MRRRTPATAMTLIALAGLAEQSHAQQDLFALLNLQQDAMIERLVTDLSAPSAERRRYSLFSLDTLLAPAGIDGPMLGVEKAVGLGLLTRLDDMAGSDDTALADDARSLRSVIEARLGIAHAAVSADVLPALGDGDRLADLPLGAWLALEVDAGQEYSIESDRCRLVGVVALDASGRRGVAGGLAAEGLFAFVPAESGTVLLRAAATACDGRFVLTRQTPAVALPDASSSDQPSWVTTGQRYSGAFRPGAEHWFRLDLAAGRYRFDLEPAAGVDTVMTIFTSDGRIELGHDDDGGNGLGSRITLTRQTSGSVLVRASELGGAAGAFEFRAETIEAPIDVARPIRVGERLESRFDDARESWWRLDVAAGASYEISTDPGADVDTLLSLFAADGTTLLTENDDYGGGLGSRVTHGSRVDGTVLIRVSEFDRGDGAFTLTVAEWSAADLEPRDAAIGRPMRGTLSAGRADWWRIPTVRGERYLIDVEPGHDVDTRIALYDDTGANEIGSNDDGGNGLGSRLDFTASDEGPYLLRIDEISGEPGRYTLRIDTRDHPRDVAGSVRPGRPVEALIGYGGESWWRVEAETGMRYVIDALPRTSIDTQMTLYRGELLERVAFDDDGGEDLGSRIEYVAAADETLYLLVREFSGVPGEFRLSVEAR